MERIVMYIRIFPGTEAEYDKRHAKIRPELVSEIRGSGIRNVTGFRRGTDVWYYAECHPDVATAFGIQGSKPASMRWRHDFRDIIAEIADDGGGPLLYDRIFLADGPPLDGRMTRGCFSLVIDPERAADYEALHASPWPEMMEALERSGFRNYCGFRRGAHVVYYGEFYPDMETVFAHIGATDVDRRWDEALRGIIVRITEADGSHITAAEVYHSD